LRKGLFLYGANCTLDAWDTISHFFDCIDITYIEYPHKITQNAHSVSDITKWVNKEYKDRQIDFIVGHSMGGIIAIELVSQYNFNCDKIVFIESNLRPANEFYRNLMMPSNMKLHGEKVIAMIKSEAPFYSEGLKASIQDDFDFTGLLDDLSCEVYGIYGDRGIENYDKRISDLCLDKKTEEKIRFRFVKNACHMPMIENPLDTAKILMECIK